MKTVTLRQAKTHLSRLIDQAATGDPFIITKHGRPIVKVVSLDASADADAARVGFRAGTINVPDDFDRMGDADIERMFGPGSH